MLIAIVVAMFAGVTIVLSRTVSARLADNIGIFESTFFNYFVGIAVSFAAMLLLGAGELSLFSEGLSPNLWLYLGGVTGVMVVCILNATVTRISSFYMTLLLFVGQVFSGVLLDIVITKSFSFGNLIGGIFVAAGLLYNLKVDREQSK